ncbi:MAG: oxidoreductase [Caldilinea sp. CFX5]|nr:oxidoreductase [Caldilinea sp. CFX5]
MKYHSVTVTRRGPPSVLQVVEHELREPAAPSEVRIKVLATPVCGPDVQNRYGQTPIALRIPYTPGYAIIGAVDAVGVGVSQVAVGDRVAALTVTGGYAEYIYLHEEQLAPVPMSVDPAAAATIVLNYLVAYQILHRAAKVKAGDKVLIIGASGGVGTAFLQLGQRAGLMMYGLASARKAPIVTAYGATPIDYQRQDFVEVIRQAEPAGLQAVFDGMGGDYVDRGFSVLAPGGTLVVYGNPLRFAGVLRLLGKLIVLNLSPNGKRVKLYGTTASRFNRQRLLADWATLFQWLAEGAINPVIMQKFPILAAAKANELLESGAVVGNLVLVAPELL